MLAYILIRRCSDELVRCIAEMFFWKDLLSGNSLSVMGMAQSRKFQWSKIGCNATNLFL